ncbi:MAG: sensor histidine kinase [Spirochaetales bacterium]|nr:sensor histidine kinase [Spirochaetales bacterium]
MQIRIHRLSLNYLITFLLMVMLPFFIFGYFINYYYGRYLIQQMEQRMSETVVQVARNLEDEINNISILASSLVHNSEFLEAAASYSRATGPEQLYLGQEAMDFHLSNLFLSTNKIGSIYIFTKNKAPYLYKNFPVHTNSPAIIEPDIDSWMSSDLKHNVIQIQDEFFTLAGGEIPGKEPLLTLLVRPQNRPVSSEEVKAFLFTFRMNLLKQMYNQNTSQGYGAITNRSGDILLGNAENEKTRQILDQDDRTGRKWIRVSAPIHTTGWTVTHAYERESLLRPFLRIRTIFNLILSGIIIIFILYTVLFFQNMINPVNHLIEFMDKVEQGDYSVRIPDPAGPEEMKHLLLAFNSMISQVDQLTRDKERNEQEKNRLELQALQYQINPHFVANTLNAIRMMAVVNKDDHIKNMTASLMQLVNDSFRGAGNTSSLTHEMESLTSYVHIMKVRFGNPISLCFTIPEELKNWKIRKMMLQPLVENAIIHGFQDGSRKGIILIQAFRKQDKLIIRITDNGQGMDLQTEGVLPEGGEERQGLTALGIRSVMRRIELNYGEDYGLKIKSSPGHYCSVTLTLPGSENEESL